jgi:hypothetical protein
MMLSWDEYDKCRQDHEQNWTALDNALYDLCKKHPDHSTYASINAKLFIIGRSYATGIERKVPSSGYQGSSMIKVAGHFYENRTKLEEIFRVLTEISEPLDTKEKLNEIIRQHGILVHLISEITRENQSTRSFASKYMHFHCPAVPIFDSWAEWSLPKLYPWDDNTFKVPDLPPDADETYGWFAIHFWNLYLEARKNRDNVSVKSIDNFLLWMAG